MRNDSFRFAFVSNSLPVAQTVRDYAAARQLHMEIRLATMEEALPVARALLDDGTDVILGGGGTGKLLRRHLRRPVVTIARSHLDILEALISAREYTRHIACTCYGAVPRWPALFAELLHVRLLPVSFTTTQELAAGISQAVARAWAAWWAEASAPKSPRPRAAGAWWSSRERRPWNGLWTRP